MKLFFTTIYRVQLLNKLVKEQRTGTPAEIAARLGLKRSCYYDLLDELKARGVPIAYSKDIRSYYYTRPFEIQMIFMLKPLDEEDKKNINAGEKYSIESSFSGRNFLTFASASPKMCGEDEFVFN